MSDLLSQFTAVYTSLHPNEKTQACVTIDGVPYNWNVVYSELQHNTAFGNQAAQQMAAMGVI